MKRRTAASAIAALAALTALTGLGPSASALGPGGTSTTDPAGDVSGKSIDLTKVAITQTGTSYQAVLKFTDLKTTPGTHRVLDVGVFLGSTSSFDFQTNPAGGMKIKMFTAALGGDATPTTCSGLKASPSNRLNKVTITIPTACWPASSGLPPYVSARAWKVPAGQWNGSSLVIPEGAPNDTVTGFFYTPTT